MTILMDARHRNDDREEEHRGDVPTKNSNFAQWVDRKCRYILGEDLGAILERESISIIHRQGTNGPIAHVVEAMKATIRGSK